MKDIKSTSVIIPTYNGAHKILNVLHSLERQSLPPDEVIVVIDGSTDGTADILQKVNLKVPEFRFIEQRNGGRAQVRNRGALEARGELLLFIDDDMIASEHWVKEHVAHHSKFKNTLATGSLEDINEKPTDDYTKFRWWQHHKWTRFDFETSDHEASCLLKNVYLTAGNFSVSKEVFHDLQGFDKRLNDAEDYDLAIRAKLNGYSIYWNRNAIAYNNDIENITCSKAIARQRQYAKAHELLQRIKPEIYNGIIAGVKYEPDILRRIVFKSLCSNWWIKSVDKGYWRWMPESLRFRLYDLIITANGVLYPNKVKIL